MKSSVAFEKPYEPKEYEQSLSEYWLKHDFFKSGVERPNSVPGAGAYTIVIPPPNVTGDLHIGHVLNNTLQDILIRHERLKGKDVCWIPGTDHASIATEAKVTKMLADKGVSKREMGREAFLKEAYSWKDEYGGRITRALKRMGASCDWSKEVFTMDEGYSRAVLSAFVDLYRRGFVYKGQRLVNWCPVSQSVISDEEVTTEERQGHLWHIAYPVVSETSSSSSSLVVATTRPETLFGDLALAVHPEDERYKHLIGQKVRVPICNREIPIIADPYVEKDFGTGVVKITPAHDMNDYEVGKRHNLGLLNVMNPDASLNDEVPPAYRGLDRYVARKKLVTELKELGLLEKIENHKLVVGISERGNVPIEYYLSDQWYFKMDELAGLALSATRSGGLTLYPKYTEKIWEHWLTNTQDWCVSRQLWWGHRIPIYTCVKCFHVHCELEAPPKCSSCGAPASSLKQEEDVLDTWASSWLWPFGVLGWQADAVDSAAAHETPLRAKELSLNDSHYYPTDIIITGQDIIFFWIARMVMAGQIFTGKIPFKDVYFTPIVRDEKGRKMSKSLGNSPDIQKIMESYGTDALRFALTNQIVLGQDIQWKTESCEMGRNFCNKIWNATRFLLTHAERLGIESTCCTFDRLTLRHSEGSSAGQLVPDDETARWLMSELNELVQSADHALASYQFALYSAKVYEFFWMVYCDWFVELLKPHLQEITSSELSDFATDTNLQGLKIQQTRALLEFGLCVFDGALRVLHPLMPFVTEEIWQRLAPRDGLTLGHTVWPHGTLTGFDTDLEAIAQMRLVQAVVSAVRTIRGQYSLHPGLVLDVVLSAPSKVRFGSKLGQMEFLSKAKFRFDGPVPKVIGAALIQGIEVFVNLEGHVEVEEEKTRIQERLKKIGTVLAGISAKLSNQKFVEGAPPEIVAGAKEQLALNTSEKNLLERVLLAMKG